VETMIAPAFVGKGAYVVRIGAYHQERSAV
jgi:hypothetical protein